MLPVVVLLLDSSSIVAIGTVLEKLECGDRDFL